MQKITISKEVIDVLILAIDPGNMESGFAVIEMPDFRLIEFGKANNETLAEVFRGRSGVTFDAVAIEMVACYGMPVGKDVFDTCVWIGRFVETLRCEEIYRVYRKDEKMCLCGDMRAKDSNIRQALVNLYAKHDYKIGKGTKKNPDTFYGVSKDVWQAIAVAVTFRRTLTTPFLEPPQRFE